MKTKSNTSYIKSSLAACLGLLASTLTAESAAPTLNQMAYNPPWGQTDLDAFNAYTAISGDGGSSNQVYASLADGGILVWGYDKAWSPSNWGYGVVVETGTFTALTRDASRSNIVFGALSTGGVVQYEYNGSTWTANIVDNSSRVYTSLTYDSTYQNKIYGASSDGLYEITYGAGWGANLLTTNVYTRIAANGTDEGLKLYGLTNAGSVDQIYFQGTWQTFTVSGANTYTTIVGDGVASNKVYGALASGGIDQMEYTSSWVINNIIVSSAIYTALASRDNQANCIYGSTTTGDFNEIAYGGGWNSTTLFTGQSYDQLIADGVRGAAVFGIALAPSGGQTYADWANDNGIPGEPADGDYDKDGLSNLLEYALGLDPKASSGTPGTFINGKLSFDKGADAVTNGDVTYSIETSTTLELESWETQTPDEESPSVISYTLPTGEPRIFARLAVTPVP
jgi:hypothetical protein